MLKKNNVAHKLLLSLIIFLLLGCNSFRQNQSIKIAPEQDINEAKSLTIKQGTSVSKTSQKPKLIKVSKTAPWLNHSVKASYTGNVDAKTALLSILDKQPVKFEVKGNGPLVKVDLKAKTFKQHLDTIVEQANWAYRISNGVVTFTDWQVINYPIHFILGQKTINLTPAGMVSNNNQESSGLSSNNNTKTSTLTVSNDSLKEIEEVMKKLLDTTKGDQSTNKIPSYSIIKSTNSILVSAPPNIQKQVKNALIKINAISGRTIHLAFDIYSVELFETYQKALDVEILKNTGVDVRSQMTTNILEGSGGASGNPLYLLSIDSKKSKYNSNIMLKALAKSGKASLANKGTLLLKNNQAGDIRATSFIEWEIIAPTDDYHSKHPRFTETIIQVLPSINGEKINLHMIIASTDNRPYLKSLTRERVTQSTATTFNLPEYQIQAEVNVIKFGEQFVIPSEVNNGETLIIGGLTRKTYTDNRSKNQMIPLFGDGRDKQQRRSETIVVITAYLSD